MGGRRARGRGGTRGGGGQKGGPEARLALEIEREIEALVGPGIVDSLDFEAIEVAARAKVLGIAAKLIAERINEDRRDYAGATIRCESCGERAAYAGRRSKTFHTALGPMALERAYYRCPDCHRGSFPRDRALGFGSGSVSAALTRMVGSVGARVSFEEGRELLDDLAGIRITAKQVERIAECLGQEIAHDEVERVAPGQTEGHTAYVGVDGTGVPMRRSEVRGRAGKNGEAKTREAKLCTVWTATERDAETGLLARDQGSTTYSAAIESAASRDVDEGPSEFANRVVREATRRGVQGAARQVFIGDGAPWIWNLAEEHFPDAVHVVDRFHAKQHIHEVAKEIYGADCALGRRWAKTRCKELDRGQIAKILAALQTRAERSLAVRRCADYFDKNRRRMRYALFHAQGICTSSGVVESGCKVVIGARLKRSGMHWSVRGANAITALRCSILSGRFEDFWERRGLSRCAA